MDIAAFGVALLGTLALLVLGKRNISESKVLPARKRAQPVLARVRREQRRKRRSPYN